MYNRKETLKDQHQLNNLRNGQPISRAPSKNDNKDGHITRMKGIYDAGRYGPTREDNIRSFM